MIIYISGAITSDFNYKEKFKQAEEKLLKMGHAVLNPTVIPPMFSHEQHMHIDYAMIDICDGLYMLKDWESSKGAKAEKKYALEKNKKIFYEGEELTVVDYQNGETLNTERVQFKGNNIAKENKNKMKIILISGKAQHGKDETAKMLFEKLISQGKKVLIAHYGDLVKYTCKTFFGWNGEKDEQGRTLLQRVGTDEIRAKYPDFWVEYVKSILNVFIGEWDYVIIPDTRFPNEIDVMKNTFKDVISLRVVRTNFISPLTEEQRNHRSEIALDDYPFDYYFIADDLKTLERKVDNLLKELEGKQ